MAKHLDPPNFTIFFRPVFNNYSALFRCIGDFHFDSQWRGHSGSADGRRAPDTAEVGSVLRDLFQCDVAVLRSRHENWCSQWAGDAQQVLLVCFSPTIKRGMSYTLHDQFFVHIEFVISECSEPLTVSNFKLVKHLINFIKFLYFSSLRSTFHCGSHRLSGSLIQGLGF